MSRLKRFIGTASIYLVGSVLSKLVALFLLPLYTTRLSPEQYGTYDLVVSVISLLAPVAFFQIWDGMFRFAFDHQTPTGKYSEISNAFFVGILGVFVYATLFWIIYNMSPIDQVWLVFIYGLTIAVNYQYTFVARVFLKNKLFVLSGLVNSLLSAIINIILILKFDMGVESLYIAPVIGSVVQVLMIENELHPLQNIHLRDVNKQKMLMILRFSIPLCVSTISYWLLSGYTKVIISQQLGTYENGLYAVASRFSSMITLVISVFQYAWNEMAYLMSGDEDRKVKYEKSVQYIFKVVMLGSVILLFIIKLIFPIFIDETYQAALSVVPLSLIGVAFNTFAGFLGTIFLAEKQTRWIFWTTILAAFINVICAWIFTPLWGLQGAVGALSLSFFILSFARILLVRNLFSIRLRLSSLLYVILFGAMGYLFFVIENTIVLIFIIGILCTFSVYIFRDILFALWNSITDNENEGRS